MGQFLNEKHNAGTKNMLPNIINVIRESGKYSKFLSKDKPTNATAHIVNGTNQYGKCCSTFISLPSSVRNFLSSIKATLLKCLTSSGTPIRVSQKITLDEIGKPSLTGLPPAIVKVINIPKVIRDAKTRFQHLYLLSHLGCTKMFVRGRWDISCLSELFINVVSSNRLKSYTDIVPKYTFGYKKIVHFVIVCTMSLSSSVVFADENGSEYSIQKIATLILQEEKKHLIPTGLLAAIAKVESNTRNLVINIKGNAHIASSISEAKSIIEQKLEEGVTNIDIGVMQLNYRWHGKQFASLDDMLHPEYNIAYAAKMLKSLKDKHGDWQTAIRYYHSYTPIYNMAYSRKVTLCWLAG